jgi:hypothetical protein
LLLFAHLALIVYGLVQWATITWSSQGRLVFSGISAIAVLMTLGLRTLLPGRARPPGLIGVAAFMALVSLASPFVYILPKYRDPGPIADLATIPNRTQVDFGSATFPAEMRLLGYAVDRASLQPGQALRLQLYWQSLVAMDRDWSVFVHVVDENGIVIAQRDTYPGLGLMPTRKWTAGQTLADTYVIPLPPAAYAPSAAHVEIGLYDFQTNERLLVVSESHPDSGRDGLTLFPLAITARTGEAPNPQAFNFGGEIALVGYEMDRRAAAPGEAITLTLYWRGLKTMAPNYSVVAHVRGEGESLWAQHDSWPLDGAAPTALWKPGELVRDVRTLRLNPDTPAGVHDVEVGLYDAQGRRLQLLLPDGRLTENFVYLSRIRVLP